VCEYVGDLIDERECKRRLENARAKNITNFYMLTLDKNRYVNGCLFLGGISAVEVCDLRSSVQGLLP
jgi:hypothetical protein